MALSTLGCRVHYFPFEESYVQLNDPPINHVLMFQRLNISSVLNLDDHHYIWLTRKLWEWTCHDSNICWSIDLDRNVVHAPIDGPRSNYAHAHLVCLPNICPLWTVNHEFQIRGCLQNSDSVFGNLLTKSRETSFHALRTNRANLSSQFVAITNLLCSIKAHTKLDLQYKGWALNPQIQTNKPQIWQLVSSITIWYVWKARCLKVFQNVTKRATQISSGIWT